MEFDIRILMASDVDAISAFENEILAQVHSDPMEQMMAVWNSKFRPEALNHYLPLGWSFGIFERESKTLMGYFIGQPLLFFDGCTQTLWVEHVQAKSSAHQQLLLETAVKISREKHFQRVILPDTESYRESLKAWPILLWDQKRILIKTTKAN